MMADADAEELFRKHADSLRRFASVLVGPTEAEDALATAMWRLLSSVDLDRVDNPGAYMFRAVMNEARRQVRRQRRAQRRERLWAGVDWVDDVEIDPDVAAAVAELPVRQRAVVFCTYWLDLSRSDTAELLGMAPGTVASHLDRARRALARRLGSD